MGLGEAFGFSVLHQITCIKKDTLWSPQQTTMYFRKAKILVNEISDFVLVTGQVEPPPRHSLRYNNITEAWGLEKPLAFRFCIK